MLSFVVASVLVSFFLSFFVFYFSVLLFSLFVFFSSLSFVVVFLISVCTIGKWRTALVSGCPIQRDCSFHLLRIFSTRAEGCITDPLLPLKLSVCLDAHRVTHIAAVQVQRVENEAPTPGRSLWLYHGSDIMKSSVFRVFL